ncbi:tigger transposable element-derived protein 6-like [Ylistrum balloti]|uniref:tigger transposable element-derived protein 6-like n=1 Tax=Ylistrum balloti TaxID=509963 RepID=UPI0029059FB9|nr:tigger transposable element-derived protein 6-like [Ylistrum balloti]
MESPTDHKVSSEGPGNQSGGGIASHFNSAEQSGEGPVFNGGITRSAGSGRGQKRKMNLQTYEIKYQAIIDIENGIKNKAVANKYGVPQNTLSTWVKNKVSIKEKFLAADIGSSRKRDKKAKFPELENALIKWFAQVRSQNIPLSGEVVKLKAKEFATKLGLSDFESSTGWLDRFKERNNLSFKKVCGESKSVDSQSNQMLDWQTKLKSILQEYQPCDIYNADETGIFFRLLPDKTLEFKDVKCHGALINSHY